MQTTNPNGNLTLSCVSVSIKDQPSHCYTTLPLFFFKDFVTSLSNLVEKMKFWLLSSIIRFSNPTTFNSLYHLPEFFSKVPGAWLPQPLFSILLSKTPHVTFSVHLSVTPINQTSIFTIPIKILAKTPMIIMLKIQWSFSFQQLTGQFLPNILFLALVIPCTSAFLNISISSLCHLLVFLFQFQYVQTAKTKNQDFILKPFL